MRFDKHTNVNNAAYDVATKRREREVRRRRIEELLKLIHADRMAGIDKDEVNRMRDAGMTIKRIAEVYGVCVTKLRTVMGNDIAPPRVRREYAAIDDWLKARNLRIVDLAAQAGVSQSVLYNVLSGRVRPTHYVINGIERVTGIKYADWTLKSAQQDCNPN